MFDDQHTRVRYLKKLPVGKVKVKLESRLTKSIGSPMDINPQVNVLRPGRAVISSYCFVYVACVF